jgi:hypothetical protein
MAEYINIRGQSIEVVASDPANPTIGQIWYNSTSNTLKGGGVTTAGAWATGGNLAAGRSNIAGTGTQTAALAIGGYLFGGPQTNSTEEYNGSIWTAGGNLSLARNSLAAAGTQTAGLALGRRCTNHSWTKLKIQQKNIMDLLGQVVEI